MSTGPLEEIFTADVPETCTFPARADNLFSKNVEWHLIKDDYNVDTCFMFWPVLAVMTSEETSESPTAIPAKLDYSFHREL